MARFAQHVLAAILVLSALHVSRSLSAQSISATGPSVDSLLDEELRARPTATAVVTFRRTVDESVLAEFRSLGIAGGYTFRSLPSVIVNITGAQRDAPQLELTSSPFTRTACCNRTSTVAT